MMNRNRQIARQHLDEPGDATPLGQEPFTWGRVSLTDVGETRTRYIAALRAADRHDIGPLLAFARS